VKMASSQGVRTILGTMEMGKRMAFNESEKLVQSFMKCVVDSPFPVELDAAYMYAGGKTEKFIGKMESVKKLENVEIASKANPFDNKLLDAKGVRHQLETSLQRLGVDSVQIFYLHAPDHNTPIRETLTTVQAMYEEGKFKELGLSNFAAWEVAEAFTICKENNWVLPTVYQGMYNCLTRQVEKELFPCLRFYNMKFYAYNPLAGGILTGKHKFEDCDKQETGRFFGSQKWSVAYRERFWKNDVFSAVDKIQSTLNEVYGDEVKITEAVIRWLYHHSALDGNLGDGVIIGCSNIAHMEENVGYSQKGGLDERVVQSINECWSMTSHTCPNYFR